MKIAWLTDIHLNHVSKPGEWWRKTVRETECDAFLVTGDIWDAEHVTDMLAVLASGRKMTYFVLGNHDYYGGSVAAVRRRIACLPAEPRGQRLKYLGNEGVVELTAKTSMVGDDGWYDGRNGDYRRTDVLLNDFFFISELSGKNRNDRLTAMRELADASAARLGDLCRSAVAKEGLEHLLVATHVPPFAGAAWHMGQPSDEFFQPFFSNRCVGQEVLAATEEFRKAGGKVTVLCGHSHSEGEIYPGGMTVRTGKAVYGKPAVCGVIEVE